MVRFSSIFLLVLSSACSKSTTPTPDAGDRADAADDADTPPCIPIGPETCDGIDEDCDGVADEGSGAEIGCDFAQVCVDGACGCPPERMCGARCIEIDRDTNHCGACGNACALGDVCAGGECCSRSGPEVCDTTDNDCDGIVDEGTSISLGCGVGASCVAGACQCDATRMCGGGCVDTQRDPEHCGGCDVACAAGEACDDGMCCVPTETRVDLLFMVDNSNSMQEEQESLTKSFQDVIRVLSSGDLGGDGMVDFPPVTDLHVGVVTSDMGTRGFRINTCTESNFGDDGILQTSGNVAIPGCAATYPTFLEFRAGADVATFSQDFTCVAQLGTGGCGFEQPLEAILKAVTPAASPIRFQDGSFGHGDRENAGFLRSDSILGIVVLSDENDCSAEDPDLFNDMSSVYDDNLNRRCSNYPEALYPIRRYVDGLLALRPDPATIVFTVIGGIPADLVTDPTDVDYVSLLADPRMQEEVDPTDASRLTPSCNVPGRGLAFPPRRALALAEQLEGFGVGTAIASICQSDYGLAMEAVAQKLAAGIGATCD